MQGTHHVFKEKALMSNWNMDNFLIYHIEIVCVLVFWMCNSFLFKNGRLTIKSESTQVG